jgi:FeS assembly SUF system protein
MEVKAIRFRSPEPVEPAPEPRDLPPDAPLRERVIAAIRTVYDPEIPVNIYDLGLVYGIDIDADGRVDIDMTLTAPGCPVAGILPGQVEDAVRAVDGVQAVHVELVWDPPWDQDRISDEAKLSLGLF